MLPKLEILSKEEIERIHLSSLNILNSIGINIPNRELLKLSEQKGAEVDYRRNTVKMPPELVNELVSKAPRKIKFYARNPKHNFVAGEGDKHFGAGGGRPFILDLKTGERRPAVRRDVKDLAIIVDALDKIDDVYIAAVPLDVPGEISHLWGWKIMAENCEKHYFVTATTAKEANYMIKMASVIAGSMDEMEKNPIMTGGVSTTSPLRFSRDALETMMVFAEHRIPMRLLPCVMSGGTGPVTLAGSLALSNAETLSSIVLSQIMNEGTPVVYSGNPRIMDMRTGMNVHAAPESLLLKAASAQLGEYYGLFGAAGPNTDSKLLDEQGSFEKAIMLSFIIRTGCEFCGGVHGGLDSGLISCKEQFVIDYEILEYVLRVIRGIEVSDKTLAFDVIDEVVTKEGSFLEHEHTRSLWRKEFWIPSISIRNFYDAWTNAGKKSIVDRATEKIENILKTHHPTPLEKATRKEMDRIMHEAEKTMVFSG